MPNLNRCEIIGHISSEPEMRFTSSGKPVCNFNVAVNHVFTSSDGNRQQETDWFSCVVWNRLAEVVNLYGAKGKLIYVSGRIKLHTWQAKENKENRARLELFGLSVLLLDRVPKDIEPSAEPEDLPF